MRITITTPFAGKSFCFDDYWATIDAILAHTDAEFALVAYDNGQSAAFTAALRGALARVSASAVVYCHDPEPVARNRQEDLWEEVPERTHRIYNRIFFELVPPCDLVLNIEDDISCRRPDAVTHMLRGFCQAAVGTVVAATWSRSLGTPFFGTIQCRRLCGNLFLRPEVQPAGFSEVDAAPMGFWLTRFSLLKEIGFARAFGPARHPDLAWGLNLRQHGHKTLIAWDVRCRHHYRDPHGVSAYTGDDRAS
jgi:hypothetical protein